MKSVCRCALTLRAIQFSRLGLCSTEQDGHALRAIIMVVDIAICSHCLLLKGVGLICVALVRGRARQNAFG